MPYRQPIEDFPTRLPFRHELVHQRKETFVMCWFYQMNHLVNDNVFKALSRLFVPDRWSV